MRREGFLATLVACFAVVVSTPNAGAQPLGTFRWQLQPFCNVVVVNITQQGAVYQVDGFDDQCGAARHAPLVGLATPNPDGTVGFGLTIVTAPGGQGVHVDARVTLPSLSGPWTDSSGNSGTFAFGASTGGTARASVGFGAVAVNPAQVQLRVSGACASPGFLIKEVRQDGSVVCGPGLNAAPNGAFDVSNPDGLVATAPTNMAMQGAVPAAEGPGRRVLWYPAWAAFRAGRVDGTQWDGVNIGFASVAMGDGTTASGGYSLAIGQQTSAGGDSSVALGLRAVATAAAHGSFVFADRSSPNTFASFAPNEFVVRAAGGVGFYTNAATTTGVEMAPNGSSWAPLSDANAKENFHDVDGEAVLARLAAMSIQEWNYKAQDAAIRHMGPTAQEFRAAFGLGDFPLRINTVDADGVALAAIKALEARTRRTNEQLQRENDDLRARLARLERLEALLKLP